MTNFHISATAPRVGRKKLWTERLLLSLAEGTTARLDAVVGEGEDRLAVIREAIEEKLAQRERAKRKKPDA